MFWSFSSGDKISITEEDNVELDVELKRSKETIGQSVSFTEKYLSNSDWKITLVLSLLV